MSGSSVRVKPRSRKDIRAIANEVRDYFKVTSPRFPIMDILEHELPKRFDKFYLGVAERKQLKQCHGLTVPHRATIYLREDIYEGALSGVGRDRFTASHELGHLFLHQDVSFARESLNSSLKRYEDSEWQANCFAGELLICSEHVNQCSSLEDVTELFGVSKDAAKTMLNVYRQEKLLNW